MILSGPGNRRAFLIYSGCCVLGSCCGPALADAAVTPLIMAVHPYNSTLSLINTHRPLQQYLSETLNRPVEFYTSAGFDGFITALLAGEYDLAICPPHFAMIALERGHYMPLVHYQALLEPLLLVRKDSPYQQPADFRGKRIAMADKTAFIRLVVIKWLEDAGLHAGVDYQIVERPTHSASISSTAMGEADAGLATATAFKQIPPDIQKHMSLIRTGLKFPHLFTLGNRRLGEGELLRLKKALLNFSSTAAGKAFFQATGFEDYENISDQEVSTIQSYVEIYRRMSAER